MKTKDLLDAVGQVGDDLIIQSAPKAHEQKKKKGRTMSFKPLLIAAAVLLIVAAVTVPLALFLNKAPEPVDPPTNTTAATLPTTSSLPAQSTTPTEPWTNVLPQERIGFLESDPAAFSMRGDPTNTVIGYAQEAPPIMEFPIADIWRGSEIVVKVRLIELLPGDYQIPGMYQSAILRFEVLNAMYGSAIPDEICLSFYYGKYSEPFLKYDAFYLSLRQICPDRTKVFHAETGEALLLPNLYTLSSNYSQGAVIAVKDGKIDVSLWEQPYWHPTDFVSDFLHDLRLQNGENASDGELFEALSARIPKNNDQIKEREHLTRASFEKVPGAEEAFAYIDSTGFFASSVVYTKDGEYLLYRRMIDGYPTTETVRIDKEGVTRSAAFTEEDMKCLPDLTQLASLFDGYGEIVHYDHQYEVERREDRDKVSCWYVKTEKGIFGVSKKLCGYVEKRVSGSYVEYGARIVADDAYWFCDQNGNCFFRTERDHVQASVGSSDFIETFPYDMDAWLFE